MDKHSYRKEVTNTEEEKLYTGIKNVPLCSFGNRAAITTDREKYLNDFAFYFQKK